VKATTSRPRGYNDADDAVDECQLGYGGSPAEHDRFLHHCARSADLGQPAARQCGRICRADHIGCQDREQAPLGRHGVRPAEGHGRTAAAGRFAPCWLRYPATFCRARRHRTMPTANPGLSPRRQAVLMTQDCQHRADSAGADTMLRAQPLLLRGGMELIPARNGRVSRSRIRIGQRHHTQGSHASSS